MMIRKSRTLRETRTIAKETLSTLSNEKRKGALIAVLSGNLGAGKTAFVKAIARALGVRETVASPTFVLERIYELPRSARKKFGFRRLVHIDAYRLERSRELLSLGFKALSQDKENLIVIEWGEKVKRWLPGSYRQYCFEFVNERTRAISRKK